MTLGVLLLLVDIVLLVGLAVIPMFRRGNEDKGDGFAKVVLPTPRKSHWSRVVIFYSLVFAVTIIVVILRDDISTWYGDAVAGLVEVVTRRANLGHALHQSVLALIPVLAALDIVCLAVVLRAPLARRLVVALNGVLLVAIAVSVDALLLAVWRASGAQVGPRTLAGVIAHMVVGTLVMVRVIMSTFQLPRPTALRLRRRRLMIDDLLALAAVVTALCLVVGLAAGAHFLLPKSIVPLASYAAYPLVWITIFVWLLWLASRGPMPKLTAHKIPIDVIIPAYNETAGIHLTLRSIDAAAVRYGGPVRVILADDGSTDGTGDVARAEMAAFRAATGIVVPGPHLGKSMALNTALSYAEARVVVRIDADIVIDPGAFLPLPTWFTDPTVGSVGSMTYPRQDRLTWFHRMRLFECLVSYGFTRLAAARVDAVACIPGTFTAFLREPVLEFGGFVSVMNGEDTDLTMQIARLGYRIVIDPRIVIFEDVPGTLGEFREQRIRWNRAGTHIAARHSPFTAGVAGPRLWLMYPRTLSMRLTALARPCILTYIIVVAILAPGSRSIVLTIVGFYLLSAAPMIFAISALAVRHRFARRLPWLATWWVFTTLRRALIVDSLFTMPVHPVRLSPLFARGEQVQGALAPSSSNS